jgi:hypothetical protein
MIYQRFTSTIDSVNPANLLAISGHQETVDTFQVLSVVECARGSPGTIPATGSKIPRTVKRRTNGNLARNGIQWMNGTIQCGGSVAGGVINELPSSTPTSPRTTSFRLLESIWLVMGNTNYKVMRFRTRAVRAVLFD